MSDVDELRAAVRLVCQSATHAIPSVMPIDEAYVATLMAAPPITSGLEKLPDPASRTAFVLVRDAINFGSAVHPFLVKEPGLSGARTIGHRLLAWFENDGIPSPTVLAEMTAERCAALLGQPMSGEPWTLMHMFARAWNAFGAHVRRIAGEDYEQFVAAANGSAMATVQLLSAVEYWDDVSKYEGTRVPFLKRARLATYGLSLCADDSRSRFDDLDVMASFADNLIPHVLLMDGWIEVNPGLNAALVGGRQLVHGSRAEVELRAASVLLCERIAQTARRAGIEISEVEVATRLWKRGQGETYKARPRPRSLTFAY